jgi:hypothetical protein
MNYELLVFLPIYNIQVSYHVMFVLLIYQLLIDHYQKHRSIHVRYFDIEIHPMLDEEEDKDNDWRYEEENEPEPACQVNIKLTSTGSSFRFSIYQRNEATGKEESCR